MMTPKELAVLAAKALDEKKGREIAAIEITDITTLADYFVIATGSSNTQINALCGAVEKTLKEQAGELPLRRRAIGMEHGCCWTTAASASMCSAPRPVPFTIWSACGRTESRWTSPMC